MRGTLTNFFFVLAFPQVKTKLNQLDLDTFKTQIANFQDGISAAIDDDMFLRAKVPSPLCFPLCWIAPSLRCLPKARMEAPLGAVGFLASPMCSSASFVLIAGFIGLTSCSGVWWWRAGRH